jgi:NAD(P)-dependent dehydrogenase (short-subunit alcohol dehydrogenase family)
MTVSMTGKRAAVTGGGRGIGGAIARALAAAGAEVTILGRTISTLDQHAEALRRDGLGVKVAPLDVTDEASVSQAFAKLGSVDILINNAGIAHVAPFEKTAVEDWERVFRVNLLGAVLCSQQVLPKMIERKWGRIVNIASTAGLKGYTRLSAYTASKHALIGMTRALALETAKTGVTVNAVCPAYTETDMTAEGIKNISARLQTSVEEARKQLTKQIPQGEMVQPEQVAAAVLWLCSAEAARVTGIALPIAGGEVM